MNQVVPFKTVSVDDVEQIYELLVADFASTNDPIAPVGIRDRGLLEMAVNRQFTGFGTQMKYRNPILSAATLTFGVCCDHAFHNGNKRTALVAMLVHLDKNEYALPGVSQDALYDLMIAIADHRVGTRTSPRQDEKPRPPADSDLEVERIARWIRERAVKINNDDRAITYRQLRQVLSRFNVELEPGNANHATLYRLVDTKDGLIRRRAVVERRYIGDVGYRDEGTEVARSEVKKIRKLCRLTAEHGVDAKSFYESGLVVDAFVRRYGRVLRRLARV